MKKLGIVLAMTLVFALFCVPQAAALQPGDAIGWAYFPENTVTLDSYYIPALKIEGKLCVIAEDLAEYGFALEWKSDTARLIIRTERTASPENYAINSHYAETYNMVHLVPAGGKAYQYLYTLATTWVGSEQVTGYNIGGRTCVPISELVRTGVASAYNEYGGRIALITEGVTGQGIDVLAENGAPGQWTDVPAENGAPGQAYYTKKTVYVDNQPIPAYEIEGKLCVSAEDLAQYGFAVEWQPETARLVICTERTAFPIDYAASARTAEISEWVRTAPAGKPVGPYYDTRITTWIGSVQVTAYNMDGWTCVPIDELARTGLARCYYKSVGDIELRTYGFVPEEQQWNYVYETPGYGVDAPTEGDYAVWEFQKNATGELALTYSEGAVGFTPSLGFSADMMYYSVEYPTTVPLGGAYDPNLKFEPRYPIAAFTESEKDYWYFWADGIGYVTQSPGGKILYPEYYRHYGSIDSNAAGILRSGQYGKSLARQTLRVWINGEQVDGIGVTSYKHRWEAGRYWYCLVYGRLYSAEEVNSIRVELRLPEGYGG